MKTRVEVRCCSKETFASEEEALRRMARIREFGLSKILPTGVEVCRHGWHLVFPPAGPKSGRQRGRRRPSKGVPAGVKAIIWRRAGGLCEVGLCCGGSAEATDPAHREGKKQGGTAKLWSNLASNLLAACRADHRLIDGLDVRGAENLGLKVREGVARPWEIPVKHARLGWVLLDDAGGSRPAPPAAYADGKRPTPVVTVAPWSLIAGSPGLDEAMARYGHGSCRGWPGVHDGLLVCSCGSTPFLVDEVA
ncbi:hypothetical protein ACIBEJ_34675 [Nonomuraea sp. NPDC050790]|uniref:hypothetical protein n=1 Tax=Nonomuraea sp. NPDC050790 TaxID=3364371 RepID=UPI0037A3038B